MDQEGVNKADARYAKAEASIRSAFLSLLEEHEFRYVTTSMIVGRASVNRSTFYAHYQDKFALLDAIEEELVDGLDRVMQASPVFLMRYGVDSDENVLAYYKNALRYLQEYGAVLFALIDNGSDVVARGLHGAVDDIVAQAGGDYGLDLYREYVAEGLTGMIAGMASSWVRNGCKDIDAFAGYLARTSRQLYSALLLASGGSKREP